MTGLAEVSEVDAHDLAMVTGGNYYELCHPKAAAWWEEHWPGTSTLHTIKKIVDGYVWYGGKC
jgi:hypothetical protein